MPAASVLDTFIRSVERDPERPALHYFEHTLSRGEVHQASDALAAALADRGVARGHRVAVFMQNVPQFVIAMLAIWKLGGIVVPLNPMMKGEETRYHLRDSGSRALIALETLYDQVGREAIAGTSVATVVTTSELDYLGDAPPPSPLATVTRRRLHGTEDLVDLVRAYAGASVANPGLGSGDIATLVYTSGTTGRPKGAMNTHGNVAFNAEVYRAWMQLGADDVVLGGSPLFHVTGLIGHIAISLVAGIPLTLFYRFEPGLALQTIERRRATFTIMTTTAFLSLMDHPDVRTRDLSSLRKVYSGGAPVPPASVAQFEILTGAYIHNLYGLTETTSPSHAVPSGVRAPVDPDSGALSVGVPVPNTLVKIVDPDTHQELPPGGVGEVWTKGPQVVPGYWERAEATAETFTEGFLHTGDVGKMDADGWFYIVDRAKDMINASGFKVWPREVEDYLYQHPAVREAAVVGVPDAYRGETVKAFVTLKAGMRATAEEIIAFARERMAAYKYPRLVEIVETLPKTASGKLVRRELRERAVRQLSNA